MTDAAAPPRGGVGRWLVLLALAGAGLVGLELALQPDAVPSPPGEPFASRDIATAPAGIAHSYPEALAKANLAVAGAGDRARSRGDEWLILETLAKAHMNRARLTGGYDDHAAAQAALDRAFAVADRGAGPHLSQAALDLTLHRLARAEAMLAAIDAYAVPDDGDRAETRLMRGDIAFYRGDYAGARARYAEARAVDAAAHDDFRWAIYHSNTGDIERARRFIDRAEARARRPTPQVRANFELRRGLLELDQGRYREALAHFRRADTIFPGWWLIEEHIAEVTARTGGTAEAERRYREIVRRTGHPELMDALAALARRRGDAAAADAWTRRARPIWERRLAQFPEAAYGHAIGHFAAAGDTARALDLARRNAAARPYGEARTELAAALLAAGRPAEAKAVVDAVGKTVWRTPRLVEVAARIDEALGRD